MVSIMKLTKEHFEEYHENGSGRFYCAQCNTFGHDSIFFLKKEFHKQIPIHWFCKECLDFLLKHNDVWSVS